MTGSLPIKLLCSHKAALTKKVNFVLLSTNILNFYSDYNKKTHKRLPNGNEMSHPIMAFSVAGRSRLARQEERASKVACYLEC